VPWNTAAPWAQEVYIQKAMLALESALPQDPVFLQKHIVECQAVLAIL
jgi:hypothetical protein